MLNLGPTQNAQPEVAALGTAVVVASPLDVCGLWAIAILLGQIDRLNPGAF